MTTDNSRADALTPREQAALHELEMLGTHRHFLVRTAVSEAWPIIERLLAASPVEQHEAAPADELGWRVRERRAPDGTLIDCFVEAPTEGDMPYAMEVLGDDYTGYGGIERKYEHCKMIVGWANANRQPEPQVADERAALPEMARKAFATAGANRWHLSDPPMAEAIVRAVLDARASSPNAAGAEGLDGLAHELWAAAQIQPRQLEGIEDGVRRIKDILSRAPAQAAEPAVVPPFGWAQPKGGNYFTRSEMTAKRIGGLIPVYVAPPPPAPASAPVGLTEVQREDVDVAIQVLRQVEAGDGTFVGQCTDAISGLDALLKGDKQ
ncbi:hypothetical bacteriophage protein [Burkholderia cenocepacia H111]|uniref:hypothetical protein n=1 Tax=Burkholderia cenocepacia TaxID=95486 RepID=UPI0002343675|nr:hypothetical protein [Burkholderia cenocepacia]CDN60004.1 hypothetical bacteriophage protein [Burkholderia cenocepacia H111]